MDPILESALRQYALYNNRYKVVENHMCREGECRFDHWPVTVFATTIHLSEFDVEGYHVCTVLCPQRLVFHAKCHTYLDEVRSMPDLYICIESGSLHQCSKYRDHAVYNEQYMFKNHSDNVCWVTGRSYGYSLEYAPNYDNNDEVDVGRAMLEHARTKMVKTQREVRFRSGLNDARRLRNGETLAHRPPAVIIEPPRMLKSELCISLEEAQRPQETSLTPLMGKTRLALDQDEMLEAHKRAIDRMVTALWGDQRESYERQMMSSIMEKSKKVLVKKAVKRSRSMSAFDIEELVEHEVGDYTPSPILPCSLDIIKRRMRALILRLWKIILTETWIGPDWHRPGDSKLSFDEFLPCSVSLFWTGIRHRFDAKTTYTVCEADPFLRNYLSDKNLLAKFGYPVNSSSLNVILEAVADAINRIVEETKTVRADPRLSINIAEITSEAVKNEGDPEWFSDIVLCRVNERVVKHDDNSVHIN